MLPGPLGLTFDAFSATLYRLLMTMIRTYPNVYKYVYYIYIHKYISNNTS